MIRVLCFRQLYTCEIFNILAILFRPIEFLGPRDLNYLGFQYVDNESSVPDEGYTSIMASLYAGTESILTFLPCD